MNIICSGQVASEKDLSLLGAQVVVFEMSHFCPLQLNSSESLGFMCFQVQEAGRSPGEKLFLGQDAFHTACGNVCHEALAQGKTAA